MSRPAGFFGRREPRSGGPRAAQKRALRERAVDQRRPSPRRIFLPVNPVDEMGTAGGAFPTIYTLLERGGRRPRRGPEDDHRDRFLDGRAGASHTVTLSGIRSN